jgi:hypothetical protein
LGSLRRHWQDLDGIDLGYINFFYPDGTPVLKTLAYSETSSLLSLQGSERKTEAPELRPPSR